MIFTTSICSNYLPRAMALAESTKKYMPDSSFVLWLLEREVPSAIKDFPYFDQIVLVKDGVDYNLDYYIFRHQIVEASTAVKGDLFKYLFKNFPKENKFVYLDPDVFAYSQFDELDSALDEYEIILTPHQLKECGHLSMEVSSLEHGIYNLGFLAVRRSEEAEKLIDWWTDRLHRTCFDLKYIGLFTDQKWFNLAPIFFKIHILKHPGYNLGPWNLMSRSISLDGDKILVEGSPLKFIHFSDYPDRFNQCIDYWAPQNKETLIKLSREYGTRIEYYDKSVLSRIPWSYSNYKSGKKISFMARMKWRSRDYTGIENPFLMSNYNILGPKGFFYVCFEGLYTRFMRKNYSATQGVLNLWENINKESNK